MAVFLFGSAALNNMHPFSDFDFALIFKTHEAASKALEKIFSQGPLSKWPVELVCLDLDTYLKKRTVGGICFEIANRGKILFRTEEFRKVS